MATVIKDIVTWLKQWFYDEGEVDTLIGGLQTQINNKADTSTVNTLSTTVSGKADATHTHGNISSDGKIGTSSGKIVTTGTGGVLQASDSITKSLISDFPTSMTPTAHNQASSTITESSALTNIGTNANATQHDVNVAIDGVISTLSSIQAIQIVDSLPTASASTLGKLYIINESGKVNVYYTKQNTGSSYSWRKMDTDILDEFTVNWSDVQNKPTSFTPSSHTHGNIANDGTISGSETFTTNDKLIMMDTTTGLVVPTTQILADVMVDSNAYTNIGSSANSTQAHINTGIDNVLGNKISKSTNPTGLLRDDGTVDTTTYLSSLPSHTHGQVTNDGKITSSAVTVASGDNIIITDASDSSKIKRVANLLASHIKDSNAHTNIGSSASATQQTINTNIDTALGNKISKSQTSGLVKNDGSIDTNTYLTSHQDISGKADKTGALGTTITLVDKGENNEGCIIFNTIS